MSGMDRRSLIKKGAIATGAAWVAPVVMTTAAGAQGVNCTSFGEINSYNRSLGQGVSVSCSATNGDGECIQVTFSGPANCTVQGTIKAGNAETSFSRSANGGTLDTPGSGPQGQPQGISNIKGEVCCGS